MSIAWKIKKAVRKHLNEDLYNKAVLPRHYAEAVAANARFAMPSLGIRVIGVTGTNGKTTTCNMIASILTAAGHKVGLLSTATLQFGGDMQENDTHLTTSNSWNTQGMLARMKAAGCDTIVMEVSSHAIVQARVLGVPIDVAVMTNLTQDHLDYHGTMENYAAAKARLFKKARDLRVLNLDDAWFTTFERSGKANLQTYGKGDLADTRIAKVTLTPSGATFSVVHDDHESPFHISQPGLFNVYNASAAITVARHYGVSDEVIQKGFMRLKSVPGRMQTINEGQPFTVIIDHAHTTDALQNLFMEVKKIAEKRIILVIGCDGDRDKTKREPIGRLSAETADVLYLTELENYTEDSEQIRAMVRTGIKSVPAGHAAAFHEIVDRREAVAAALKEAKAGDIVLIPGLGNQDYRGMGEGKIAWDDRQVVREELQKLGYPKK